MSLDSKLAQIFCYRLCKIAVTRKKGLNSSRGKYDLSFWIYGAFLSIKTSFKKLICSTMRHPGSCLRDEDFEGQLGRMDDEFRTTLEELIPYVCNDSTDDSGSCPVIKTDPMENNMTCDDFIEQVNMLKEVFESGQIESPESLYSAYSKVSHGKASRNKE